MAAAFVQHLAETDGNGVATTSTVLSPSSKTVTSGNVIVAGVSGLDGIGTTPSCVDNLGNTYTLVRSDRAAAEDGAMFVAPVTTGGSITSITFTHASTRFRAAEAAEWSGVDATNWVDGLGSPTDSNPGTTITGIGDVVSIPANGMAVWFSAGNTNQTYSAGAASGSPSMTPVLADAHASANMSCGILYALAGTTTVSYFRGTTTVTGTGGYTSYGAIFNVPYAALDGEYLLEAGTDGYLLEDGSGVLIGEDTTADIREADIVVTGGGILTPSSATTRTRTQTVTGGGILTPASVTTRTSTVAVTGAGILTPSSHTIRPATVEATGAGVATVDATAAEIHTADVTVTGGGVATAVGTKRGELTYAATGGGVLVQVATTIRTSVVTVTGGGIATVTSPGLHAVTVVATGSGSATATATTTRTATPAATGGGTIPIDAETWRLAEVLVTGGGVATVSGGPFTPAQPGSSNGSVDPQGASSGSEELVGSSSGGSRSGSSSGSVVPVGSST